MFKIEKVENTSNAKKLYIRHEKAGLFVCLINGVNYMSVDSLNETNEKYQQVVDYVYLNGVAYRLWSQIKDGEIYESCYSLTRQGSYTDASYKHKNSFKEKFLIPLFNFVKNEHPEYFQDANEIIRLNRIKDTKRKINNIYDKIEKMQNEASELTKILNELENNKFDLETYYDTVSALEVK